MQGTGYAMEESKSDLFGGIYWIQSVGCRLCSVVVVTLPYVWTWP